MDGATMNDVVKIVTYVTDIRNLPEAGKCRTEALGDRGLASPANHGGIPLGIGPCLSGAR